MKKPQFQSLLCPSENVSAEQLETDRRLLAFDRSLAHLSRRGFLGGLLAAAAATGVRGAEAQTTSNTSLTIVDVLNFALNLEYLEANFYTFASTGSYISSSINGGGPAPLNGPSFSFTDSNTAQVCRALAADEVNHINDLRQTISQLGGTPIVQPQINLGANGAITTQAQFLSAARQFTALGGSAYVGGAALLVSNAAVLTAAAQILGAEGQHAGVLGFLCVTQGVTSPAIDAQDVPPTSNPPSYFTVAATTALSPSRSPQQALGVVYGVSTATTVTPASNTTMGGFFPNGVNGTVKST